MPDHIRKVRVRGIILHQGKYLFVQHNHDQTFWALPGGKLDDGETLENGLKREIIEELGIKPVIGRLLYIQQLFLSEHDESLEFFFLIENGADYLKIDLENTTHGALELSRAVFMDADEAKAVRVMPDFLTEIPTDFQSTDWPKVIVRRAVTV